MEQIHPAPKRAARLALLMTGCLLSFGAQALEFDIAGTTVKMDNLFTAGTLIRMQDRAGSLIGKSNLQPGICVRRTSGGSFDSPNRTYAGNTCNPEKTNADGQNANTAFVNQPGSFSPNGDNGDLSYDKYDVVSAISKLTTDISFSYEDFNFFARTVGYFDVQYYNHDLKSADLTALPESRNYSDSAKRLNGLNFKFLDYFVNRNFEIAGHPLNIKIGNQVLNWGESSFLLANSLNAINPPNQALLREPGFDLKELLQPVGMVLLEGDLIEGYGFQTFVQYEWKPVIPDPVGSFFSSSDIVGEGGDYAMLSFSKAPEDPQQLYQPRLNPDDPAFALNSRSSRTILVDHAESDRREPRGLGQYGFSLKHLFKELNNGTEIALYFANYHSRIPSISGFAANDTCLPATAGTVAQNVVAIAAGCSPTNQAAVINAITTHAAQIPLDREALPLDSARLIVEYPEDIRMFGASFNTTVGDIAVSGEYVFRPNLPIQVHSTDLVFALLQPAFPAQDLSLGPAGTLPGRRSAVPDFVATNYRGAPPTAGSYVRGWEPMKVGQAGLTFLKTIGGDNILGASQITLLLEMGHTHVFDFPDLSELQFNGAGTDTHISSGADGTVGINPRDIRTDPNNPATSKTETGLRQNPTSYAQIDIDGFGTADSYGYRLVTLTRYDSALFGANVELLNALFHDVGGVGPGIGQNFVEGRKQILSGVRFDYLSRFIGEIRYTWYTGGGLRDQLRDRDNLLLSLGYQF